MLDFLDMRLFSGIFFFFIVFLSQLIAVPPIKLGMSAPLTGAAEHHGKDILRGSKPVFEKQNKLGGIHGRPIELIIYDDGYNPEQTLQNTITFIQKDKVDALFSYVGTPTVAKILPILRQHKNLTLYFPFTGAQPQRQPPYSQFVRNFRASYYKETDVLVRYFLKNEKTRIAVFYQIDAYGRNGWHGVKQSLEEHHKDIVAEATYKRGTLFSTSFIPQVDSLLKEKPDAIIVIGSYQAAAGFIRDFRAKNSDIPIANISFVGTEALIDLLKPIPQVAHNLVFSHVVPNPVLSQTAAAKEFRTMANPPTFTAFEGFLNAKLLIEILKNPEAKQFEIGLEIPITFDTQNQAQNNVYLSLYSDGKWTYMGEPSK